MFNQLLTLINQKGQSVFYQKVLLLVAFLLVQFFCWLKFGVVQYLDSENYIEYGQHILQNFSFPYRRLFWYTSYALFLAFFQLFKLSLLWVVLTQILLSAFAVLAIYLLTLKISNYSIDAFVATLLYIICIKIQWWNNYILTESLFISCNVLLFYAISKFREFSWRIFMILPFLLFIFFIRPSGLITVAAFAVYVFYLIWNEGKFGILKNYLIMAFVLLIALLADKMVQNYGIIESLQSGAIICGIENLELSTTASTKTILNSQSTTLQLAFFISNNPVYFIQLSFNKMIYFWSTYRPDYSVLHNIFSLLFFSPVYLLAIFGWWKSQISKALKIYWFTFITLTCFLVIITCVNWDSRFLAPVLPFVFVLSGLGFGSILRKFNN